MVFNRLHLLELMFSVGDTYTSHYRLDIRYGPENLWASLGLDSETQLGPLVETFLHDFRCVRGGGLGRSMAEGREGAF